MRKTSPLAKSIQNRLFQELEKESTEQGGLFTADDFAYFFKAVFPHLEDEDGFYEHYKATMQLSDKDLACLFTESTLSDLEYSPFAVFKAMSCISSDTKLFHLNDETDCQKLADNFRSEQLTEMLCSNLQPSTKAKFFNLFSETEDYQNHSDYDLIGERTITHYYKHRNLENPKEFLEAYDGVIANAILKRNLDAKLPSKVSKTKTAKI